MIIYPYSFRINQNNSKLIVSSYANKKYDMDCIYYNFDSRYPTYTRYDKLNFKIAKLSNGCHNIYLDCYEVYFEIIVKGV